MSAVSSLRALLFGGAIAVTSALPAFAQDTFLRVGGGLAGTYPLFAAKLVELINGKVEGVHASVVPGDTEPTQIQLSNGEVEFNIGYTFVTGKIFEGKGGLGVPTPNARHLITLYGSTLQALSAPGKVKDFADINNGAFRVWTGPEGFIFDQMVTPTLAAHGVTRDTIRKAGGVTETLGYASEIQAFQDGNLDVAFFAGGVPYGLLQQVEKNPGFNLIPFTDEGMAKAKDLLPGIGSTIIPKGTYAGQTEDVQAMHFVNHLVVGAEVSDDIVYQVTKIMMEDYAAFHGLFAGSEEIDAVDPLANNVLPVHPGAERYYREAGILK